MVGLAQISLRNRMITVLLTIVVVIFGIIATLSMRVELFPSVAAQGAGVTATYPGASPEVMEREIVTPIEAVVGNVDDVDRVTSTVTGGSARVNATIDLDADTDAAIDEVRSGVDGVRPQLPAGAEVEVVALGAAEDEDLVLGLAASAEEDERTLSSNLDEHVIPELEALPGVRDVQVFGERQETVTIVPDEEALEEEDLTTADIATAVRDSGVVLPGGELTEEEQSLSVNVGTELESPTDLEDLYLPPAAPQPAAQEPVQGAAPPQQPEAEPAEPVQLGDIADVDWGLAEPQTLSRANGVEAVSLRVVKETGANAVEVSDAVRAALPELEDALGDEGELVVTADSAPFIENSIDGLVEKGLAGLAIVVVLILAFLRSARITVVTAVSIPLSLLIALIVLWQTGHTLNIITLAGLTVAIGRVVDDTIVVLENIKRHLSYGGERILAITTAVREVAGAITAATLTTVAVFLPLAFIGGLIGVLFGPFAIAVSAALLASLLVALTIIPVLAYWFAHSQVVPVEDRERHRQETQQRERRAWLQRTYIPVLTTATRRSDRAWPTWRRWAILGAGVALLLGTVALTPFLRYTLLDDAGENQLRITQELPAGTSLGATDTRAGEVEAVLAELDAVESYETTVGSDSATIASHLASYWVTLTPDSDPEAVRQEIQDRLDALQDVGELEVTTGIAAVAAGDATTDVSLTSTDTDGLEEAEQQVSDMLTEVSGVTSVTSDLVEEQSEIDVEPVLEEAAEHGLDEAQIAQVVETALGGAHAGTVLVGGAERPVLIDVEETPATLDELREYEFATPAGTVELGEVADVDLVERPVEIIRTDGERSVTVSAAMEPDADLQAAAMEVQAGLDELDLPADVAADVGGDAGELGAVQEDMLVALLTSVAIVFVIMVATFRSLAQSLALLVSVPFAATGAVAALLVTGIPMGLPAMIGLLMLVGIVVTNAIVLIDLVNQYRSHGMPLRDAVIEGGRQRLRPVLMTALATMGALTPMAVGWGTGSVFISQSLAVVVIGGLLSSTVLTLLILPALYMMVEESKQRWGPRREWHASRHGDHARRDRGPGSADEEPSG